MPISSALFYRRRRRQPPPKSASRSATKSWPATSSALAASSASSVASSPASKPTLTKKFSAAEITDRQAKGLCFKCHDKFVSVHRDVCKRLFCIEVASNDGDDSDPTISIHALISIQSHATSTMQLLVTIGGATLCALLDSGSMHNFIDTVAAQHAASRSIAPRAFTPPSPMETACPAPVAAPTWPSPSPMRTSTSCAIDCPSDRLTWSLAYNGSSH
jgi:hypothetical protein